MTKEELAKEIYEYLQERLRVSLKEGADYDLETKEYEELRISEQQHYIRIVEYLLSHYHVIPKSVTCYSGKIDIDKDGDWYIGELPLNEISPIYAVGKYARLFIEKE